MSDAYQLFIQAKNAIENGHADEAITPLERARKLEPNSNSILEALGTTYLKVGFNDRAIEVFSTIIERDPVDAHARYCLGRAYDRIGDVTEARRNYKLAAFFEPERKIYSDTLNAFLARNATFDGDDDDDGTLTIFGE